MTHAPNGLSKVMTAPPRRVLIIKTSSMGDLVHTLSAVQEVAHYCPNVEFDWVCEESFLDIPRLAPRVGRVLPVAIRRWRRRWWTTKCRAELKLFVKTLRQRDYDIVIDAQGLLKTAWITRLARCNGEQRWGYDYRSIREKPATWVLNHRVTAPEYWHAIERLRVLFGAALGFVPKHDEIVTCGVGWSGSQGGEILFLHGTSRREKSWPVADWIALGHLLIANGFSVTLPSGSDEERIIAQKIAQELGAQARILPRQSIGTLVDVIRSARGSIGVDSGLMHLSVALGCPTVALMTAAHRLRYSSSRFAPIWADHARVLSASSQSNITVDQVFKAWDELCT